MVPASRWINHRETKHTRTLSSYGENSLVDQNRQMKIQRNGAWAPQDIIALRERLNITQTELGQKLGGFNQVNVCKWERGKTRPSRSAQNQLTRLAITLPDEPKGEPIPTTDPVIESGIPIPAQGTWSEIARQMNFGDSCLLPYKEGRALMVSINRTGGVGVQRQIGDKLRVWKVEKPVVHRSVISQAMSELGKRKKTMSPAAIKARQAAGKASAKARRAKWHLTLD